MVAAALAVCIAGAACTPGPDPGPSASPSPTGSSIAAPTATPSGPVDLEALTKQYGSLIRAGEPAVDDAVGPVTWSTPDPVARFVVDPDRGGCAADLGVVGRGRAVSTYDLDALLPALNPVLTAHRFPAVARLEYVNGTVVAASTTSGALFEATAKGDVVVHVVVPAATGQC